MLERFDIYRCECGGLFEVVRGVSPDSPKCCGRDMTKLTENTTDGAKEKHLPVMEKTAGGILATVGSVKHPMEEKHFIEWIYLVCENGTYSRHLHPGEEPAAEFLLPAGSKPLAVYEFCNLHGIWKADV